VKSETVQKVLNRLNYLALIAKYGEELETNNLSLTIKFNRLTITIIPLYNQGKANIKLVEEWKRKRWMRAKK